MNDFATRIMTAPLGRTHLFSVGQAGFIIKSKRGQLLAIDLYLSNCVERVEGHVGYKRMLPKILEADELIFDCIVATHFHRDHFDVDSIPKLMDNDKTKLFAAYDCSNDVDELNIDKNRVTFVKPGDSAVCGDFSIDFINCDHGTGAPQAVGVIVEVDGYRICETGDTSLRLDRTDEYLSKGKLNVLIAPVNGAYGNLNEQDCVMLSKALQPELTIPCHYGMFASHGGNLGIFHDMIRQEKLPYLLMTMGEQYTF